MSNADLPSFIPKPILSGLGVISSSALSLVPAPNWISNWLLVLNRDIKRLVDFFNFRRKGVWLLLSNNSNVLNFSADPIVNVCDLVSPEIALVDFFNK